MTQRLPLGMYPKEFKAGTLKDMRTSVLTAPLFTTGRRGSDPSAHPRKNGYANCGLPTRGMLFNLKKG